MTVLGSVGEEPSTERHQDGDAVFEGRATIIAVGEALKHLFQMPFTSRDGAEGAIAFDKAPD